MQQILTNGQKKSSGYKLCKQTAYRYVNPNGH